MQAKGLTKKYSTICTGGMKTNRLESLSYSLTKPSSCHFQTFILFSLLYFALNICNWHVCHYLNGVRVREFCQITWKRSATRLLTLFGPRYDHKRQNTRRIGLNLDLRCILDRVIHSAGAVGLSVQRKSLICIR